MSNSMLERLARIEREVWGDVCRCCNRQIGMRYSKGFLAVSDRDSEGFPRCDECAPPVKLDGFGCCVWLEDGTLICSEIGEFEEHGTSSEYAVEVTAPEGQGFLDAVNEAFGTDFRFDQFAGR